MKIVHVFTYRYRKGNPVKVPLGMDVIMFPLKYLTKNELVILQATHKH